MAILALVAVSVFGTAAALAYDRHWDEPWQLVPWGTLAGITLAAAAFLIRVTRLTIWLAKAMAIITIVVAGLGGWQHFNENYKTAPLDARYSGRWGEMSVPARWWTVISGSAGHVPILAVGALVPVGMALGVATIGLAPTGRKTSLPERQAG